MGVEKSKGVGQRGRRWDVGAWRTLMGPKALRAWRVQLIVLSLDRGPFGPRECAVSRPLPPRSTSRPPSEHCWALGEPLAHVRQGGRKRCVHFTRRKESNGRERKNFCETIIQRAARIHRRLPPYA